METKSQIDPLRYWNKPPGPNPYNKQPPVYQSRTAWRLARRLDSIEKVLEYLAAK
jgi:hypothetical protein